MREHDLQACWAGTPIRSLPAHSMRGPLTSARAVLLRGRRPLVELVALDRVRRLK